MSQNIEGSAWGSTATLLGTALGWVSAASVKEAVVLAIVGALVGYLTNKGLKLFEVKLKSWWKKLRRR